MLPGPAAVALAPALPVFAADTLAAVRTTTSPPQQQNKSNSTKTKTQVRPALHAVQQAPQGATARDMARELIAARWPRARERPPNALALALALLNAAAAWSRPSLRLEGLDTELPARRHQHVLARERHFWDEQRALPAIVATESALRGAAGAHFPAFVNTLANAQRARGQSGQPVSDPDRLLVALAEVWAG